MEYDFTKKIEEVRRLSAGVPKLLTINLADAATDRVYDIAGNLFYVFSAQAESDYVGIKINETRESMINYSVHCGLKTPFYRLYITTVAGQAGIMQIIYGTEAPELLEILDHRSTTVAGVGGIADELIGPTLPINYARRTVAAVAQVLIVMHANRHACVLKAHSGNAASIYLGFDNLVTAIHYFAELVAGEAFCVDDYRGDIWGISTQANQFIGTGVW